MPNPSKLDQEIAARRAERVDPEPLYATWQTGIEWRPCIMDCNRETTNADGICDYHDVFGEPTEGVSC